MKIIVCAGEIGVRRVTKLSHGNVIFINIETEEKYPVYSMSRLLDDPFTEINVNLHTSETSNNGTLVRIVPENEAEHKLLDNCYFPVISNSYGLEFVIISDYGDIEDEILWEINNAAKAD